MGFSSHVKTLSHSPLLLSSQVQISSSWNLLEGHLMSFSFPSFLFLSLLLRAMSPVTSSFFLLNNPLVTGPQWILWVFTLEWYEWVLQWSPQSSPGDIHAELGGWESMLFLPHEAHDSLWWDSTLWKSPTLLSFYSIVHHPCPLFFSALYLS